MAKRSKAKTSVDQPTSILPFALALAILVTVAYWGVQSQQLITLDDPSYVTDNSFVQQGLSLKTIKWAFSFNGVFYWHPMTWLTLLVDYDIYGMDAGGYKRTNAILHCLSSILLFLLLWRTTRMPWPSFVAAALFAVHPLHVESVAWITERKDVLFLFLGLLSLHAYVQWCRRRAWLWYAACLLALAMAMMAKVTAMMLPGLFLLLDAWPLGRMRLPWLSPPQSGAWGAPRGVPGLVLEKLPFILVAMALAVVVSLSIKAAGSDGWQVTPLSYNLENALVTLVAFLWKLALPLNLAVFYPLRDLPAWKWGGSLLCLGGISAFALYRLRDMPFLAVGWFWYLIASFPSHGILRRGGIWPAMADRFAYLPLIGIYILLAFWTWHALRNRPHKRSYAWGWSGALCVLTILTIVQVGYWRNSQTLFEHALAVTEDNWLAHNSLGVQLAMKGRQGEAYEHFKIAHEIMPLSPLALENLANMEVKRGNPETAIALYKETLAKYPDRSVLLNDYGRLLMQLGRREEALVAFEASLRQGYDPGGVLNNMAVMLAQMGRFGDAAQKAEQALEHDPGNVTTLFNLAGIYARLHEYEKSRITLNRILAIDPRNRQARQALASLAHL